MTLAGVGHEKKVHTNAQTWRGIDGDLFIADTGNQRNHRVRRVAADGTITTVFGSSHGGTTASSSYYPSGVAVDRSGSLLIADPFNHRIWKVTGLAAPGLIAGQPFPVPEPQ